jgi:cytochrome c oxidase subunit 2
MFGQQLYTPGVSTLAERTDLLFALLLGIAVLFCLGLAGTVTYFSIKYRRGRPADRTRFGEDRTKWLELTWVVVPLGALILIFFWSAWIFTWAYEPPTSGENIQVVAQQWMWKFEHMNGRREINELHMPAHTPMRLIMASQDVIHSLYVPAFRFKMDVVPGRYQTAWFEATKPGRYHLFCAEFCGTQHADMGGAIIVMSEADYAAWLGEPPTGESPVAAGARLFDHYGCVTCHGNVSAPNLAGRFGHAERLEGGGEVVVDENYIRESIVSPRAKIVAGYQALMPSFKDQLSEDELLALVEYVKSLSPPPAEKEPR